MNTLSVAVQTHFGALGTARLYGGPIGEIVARLASGSLTKLERRQIHARAGTLHDESYRKAEIDLVLSFFEATLGGRGFEEGALRSFESLKEIFEVREGELLRYRPAELATMLGMEVEKILEDEVVDPAEDEYQARLQDALDLGFDQYMALCRRAFENASLRLHHALTQETSPEQRAEIQRKISALEPLIRLAELQQRTLGALY